MPSDETEEHTTDKVYVRKIRIEYVKKWGSACKFIKTVDKEWSEA